MEIITPAPTQQIEVFSKGESVKVVEDGKHMGNTIYYGSKDGRHHVFSGQSDFLCYKNNSGSYTVDILGENQTVEKNIIDWFGIDRNTPIAYLDREGTPKRGYFDKVVLIDDDLCAMVYIDGMLYEEAKGKSVCIPDIETVVFEVEVALD